jgi:phosphopantetheinyl transferase (holo-ACP synthase)
MRSILVQYKKYKCLVITVLHQLLTSEFEQTTPTWKILLRISMGSFPWQASSWAHKECALKCVTFICFYFACITRITLWRGAQLVHQSNERNSLAFSGNPFNAPGNHQRQISHSRESPPRFSFSTLSLGFEISDNEQLSCFYAVKAMR